MQLINHPTGDYRFLPGILPYSCGAVARPGFEVVQATFQRPPTYQRGFERIAKILDAYKRPKAALCGVSLRSPRPYTFQGFADFNAEYTSLLKNWGVFVDGVNPVARTNVAPVIDPPSEPSLYGFSFTQPCPSDLSPTFVVAGAGELPEGILSREAIVSIGDTSAEAISLKARFVLDLMQHRLRGLGVDWPDVTTANIYTIHSFVPLPLEFMLERMDVASSHGVHWFYSRPPVEDIEFEMDVRGTRIELRYG